MQQQLDLSLEARNLRVFRERFASDSWATFPRPIEGFVCKNVLGKTITRYVDPLPLIPLSSVCLLSPIPLHTTHTLALSPYCSLYHIHILHCEPPPPVRLDL